MTLLCSVESGFDGFGATCEQVRSGAVASTHCNGEPRTGLVGLERFRTLFKQFRCGAVGSAPCNKVQPTDLIGLERLRMLFEQVVAWCMETIACCRAL